MSIDSTIKKMEAALRKKKELRTKNAKARLAKLQERSKVKEEKIIGLQGEVDEINTQIQDLNTWIITEGTMPVVDAEFEPEESKPATAAEGSQKDDNKKTPHLSKAKKK